MENSVTSNLPFGIQSWSSIIESDVDPPACIVDGIIEQGSISLLVGRAKEGKSLLAAQLSIDVGEGKPFLGKLETKQGKVCYIDYENRSHRIKARGQDLASGRDVSNVLFAAFNRISERNLGLDGENLDRLKKLLEQLKPNLLIIDPLRLAGDTDLLDPRKVVTALDTISGLQTISPSTGIILVHHLIKGQGDFTVKLKDDPRSWVERTFGSQALLAHVETIVGLERDGEGLYTLATVPRSSEPIIWSLEKAVQSERFIMATDESQVKTWTPAYQEGWSKLPEEFSWSEGVKFIGNSTLDRIIRKAKPLSLIFQDPKTKRYKKVTSQNIVGERDSN
jgi:hypothetical protein